MARKQGRFGALLFLLGVCSASPQDVAGECVSRFLKGVALSVQSSDHLVSNVSASTLLWRLANSTKRSVQVLEESATLASALLGFGGRLYVSVISGDLWEGEVALCGIEAAPAYASAREVADQLHAMLGGASMSWSWRTIGLEGYQALSGQEIWARAPAPVALLETTHTRAAVHKVDGHLQLTMEDVIMSDTRDEGLYHEFLVHPALLATPSPQRVLIIGGAEGATLREVLRNPSVDSATMVDIDEELVGFCRTHLADMHQGSFDSPRATIAYADGFDFLRRADSQSFDVILVDGVDYFNSVGNESYGNALFSSGFYQEAHRVLSPGGTLSQYMSDVDRRTELIGAGFQEVVSLTIDVPSFYGGGARFALATRDHAAESVTARVLESLRSGVHKLRHLDSSSMRRSLAYRARRLKSGDDDEDEEIFYAPNVTMKAEQGDMPTWKVIVITVSISMVPLTMFAVWLAVDWDKKQRQLAEEERLATIGDTTTSTDGRLDDGIGMALRDVANGRDQDNIPLATAVGSHTSLT